MIAKKCVELYAVVINCHWFTPAEGHPTEVLHGSNMFQPSGSETRKRHKHCKMC